MEISLDPKIVSIMHTLRSRGFAMKGIRQGIRLKLQGGIDADIYTLKFDAEKLRARLKLSTGDEGRRAQIIRDVGEKLQSSLSEAWLVEDFKFSRYVSGNYYYYSRLFYQDTLDGVSLEGKTAGAGEDTVPEADAAVNMAKNDLRGVVDMLETVDSKMFRKAIDELGLARTSILRVVLTRLFRAAADVSELKASIAEEAEKIIDPADRADLENVLHAGPPAFIEPLVRRLHQCVFGDSEREFSLIDS